MMNHERREAIRAVQHTIHHNKIHSNGFRWMVIKVSKRRWVAINKTHEKAYIISYIKDLVWNVKEVKFPVQRRGQHWKSLMEEEVYEIV